MLSPLRNRFGIPGVISVIALVFAMFGGAYAASSSSDGGKATSSAKAKKGPRGPRGPKGPAGPAGPAGPQGPAGAKGDKGDGGSAGSDGKGAETVSFTGEKTIGAVTCKEGGLEVKSASATTLVCNGKKGTNGTPGIPGPPGPSCNEQGECLLPPEATETGIWVANSTGETAFLETSISYPLRLSQAPTSFHFVTEAEWSTETPPPPAECPGDNEHPEAEPGSVCLYENNFFGLGSKNFKPPTPTELENGFFDRTSGLPLKVAREVADEEVRTSGGWAVTACPEGGCS